MSALSFMNDNILSRNSPQLAAFAPLLLLAGPAVLLRVGLTLNPREAPSPLIEKLRR